MTRRSSSPQYRKQERRRARGLCLACLDPNVDGYRCEFHRQQHRALKRAWYRRNRARIAAEYRQQVRAKLAFGLCAEIGCEEPRRWMGEQFSRYCRKHLAHRARWMRGYRQRRKGQAA